MKRRPLGVFVYAVLFAPVSMAEDASATRTGDVMTSPKAIDPKPSHYPEAARNAGREGWVLISRCIDLAGKAVDPVIVSSSGFPDFERAALDSVRDSRYEPATLNGEPVESCDEKVMFQFQLQHGKRSARLVFVAAWKKARDLIDAGQLDEAKQVLDAIDSYTSYEVSQADMLWAEIYRLRGDSAKELLCLESAITFPEDLAPKQEARVLRRIFALQLKTQRYGEALETHRRLRAMGSWPDDEKEVGEQLVALVDGPQPISTEGIVEPEGRFASEFQAPVWSAKLLRREFGFRNIIGTPDRFELRCVGKHYRSSVDATTQWKVPNSWGECWIYVFGQPGVTFQFVEFPKTAAVAPG